MDLETEPKKEKTLGRPSTSDCILTKGKHRLKKLLLCVFWTQEGILHHGLLHHGCAVTADVYGMQFKNSAQTMQQNSRNLQRQRYLPVARFRVVSVTESSLEQLGRTELSHAPYSPDLAPADFQLIRPV
ncbi:hypothetical protein M514_11028 [Trichuris suis]|uniref:Mos1 transposase HTH domain-containing protein n=1 Tax=Trichuris suis TaxID=68888 RepID=A0A085MW58_9BILA|nr:hypothetical protein M513_11028 [Trichuris suis]KFD61454.1 hypothetical protein M514_11028 [Trichuris suis]